MRLRKRQCAGIADLRHFGAEHADRAGSGARQHRHQTQQRRLAAAAAADDGENFAARHVEIHTVEHTLVCELHFGAAHRDERLAAFVIGHLRFRDG